MDTGAFFVQPRPKKGLVPPPPSKKRKTVHKVEEVTFDKDARTEYLSGFRKRKQARIKHAQEIAAQKAREEKIEMRKQIREERKKELEEHVQHVHRLLREANSAGVEKQAGESSDEGWDGLSDEGEVEEPIDHEEEYIDEGRHTVVTVEAVSVDKEGLYKPIESESEDDEDEEKDDTKPDDSKEDSSKKSKDWPKKKKKKFRYETKLERRLSDQKQKSKRAR